VRISQKRAHRPIGVACLLTALCSLPLNVGWAATPVSGDPPTVVEKSNVNPAPSSVSFQVVHETIALPVNFDRFTGNLVRILGKFDRDNVKVAATDPKLATQRFRAAEGAQDLMLFDGTNNHGALFALIGESRQAMRYHIGNPLIALGMTQKNIGVALYVPLTILVYAESDNLIKVEYDQPSTLLGRFKDPAIDSVGRQLDSKLLNLIYMAASLSTG
jgi:hypothetical protein